MHASKRLYDAVLVRAGTQTAAEVDADVAAPGTATNTVLLAVEDFEGDIATVGFTAVDGATYRLRVRDAGGTLLTNAFGGAATQGGTWNSNNHSRWRRWKHYLLRLCC